MGVEFRDLGWTEAVRFNSSAVLLRWALPMLVDAGNSILVESRQAKLPISRYGRTKTMCLLWARWWTVQVGVEAAARWPS